MRWRPDQTAERAVRLCRADGCVAIVTDESEANLRWANNSHTTGGVSTSRQLTVIATVDAGSGTRVGVVSRRGDLDSELAAAVELAELAARAAEPAEDAQPLVAGDGVAGDWEAPVAETSMDEFAELVPALGDAFALAGSGRTLLYGYAEHRARSVFLASSSGVRLRADHVGGYFELTGRSVDHQRSAWANSAGDLGGGALAGRHAEVDQRLRWAGRRVELPPGRYPVLLPPAAVADLVTQLYRAAGAREAVEGQSVFSARDGATRVGERLTAAPLALRSNPAEPGVECPPFLVAPGTDPLASVFDNGLPVGATAWIDDGKLRALVQTRHSAALTGMPLTPHVDNLVLEEAGASGTLGSLVADTAYGLLLTTLWYIRDVDLPTLLLTGLTRDGVYLVEHGEIVGAVNNFRFNESPVDLLGRVTGVGATVRTRARESGEAFSGCAMPPMRVADFCMSSVSRAI